MRHLKTINVFSDDGVRPTVYVHVRSKRRDCRMCYETVGRRTRIYKTNSRDFGIKARRVSGFTVFLHRVAVTDSIQGLGYMIRDSCKVRLSIPTSFASFAGKPSGALVSRNPVETAHQVFTSIGRCVQTWKTTSRVYRYIRGRSRSGFSRRCPNNRKRFLQKWRQKSLKIKTQVESI